MIKLVLTDLDGTLVAHGGGGAASKYAMDAINALLSAGLRFGPVTGRTPISMADTFHGDARLWATGAFANGQLVYLDGEVIHRQWCAAEALQQVAAIMDTQGMGTLVVYDMEGGSSARFVTAHPERVRASSDFGAHVNEVVSQLEAPALKANVHMDAQLSRKQLSDVRELLSAEVPELDFVFPSPTAPLIDILPAGYSKGSAVRIIAETLGLTLDEVAAFGDSENDSAMLQAVPNSVAVAGADEVARSAARWHIGSVEEEAVADALLDIAAAAAREEMPAFMQA